MADALSNELDKRWRATCRAVLGQDVGPLQEYGEWLSSAVSGMVFRNSSVSGKPVAFVLPHYPENATVQSFEEVDWNRKYAPLSINEIKDIDSIVSAVRERTAYAGGVSLGTSKMVEKSTDVVDSFYVSNSEQVSFSKYVSYCNNFEYSSSMFGCVHFGESNFCISCWNDGKITRSLELHSCRKCSDSYYCHNLFSSQNAMFSFNLRNANFVIGNMQLTMEKYAELKKKLLEELAEKLRKEKKLPSLLELAGAPPEPSLVKELAPKLKRGQKRASEPAFPEEKFRELTRILLGKQLSGMEKYGQWLRAYANRTKIVDNPLGGEIEVPDYADFFSYPEQRLVGEEDALALGSLKFEDVENPSLEKMRSQLGKIAFFYAGHDGGKVENAVRSHVNIDSSNCFCSTLNLYSKNCVHSFYSLESDTVFGCNSSRRSSFLLRCCLATRCARCFEIDSCMDCTDLYFSHNCENVRDSMFCFNIKNKTNAIGNVELPQEEYRRIKAAVLGEIASRLERSKSLDFGIFSLGG